MPFSPATPVTGAAVTGLTTPTYTLSVDTAPSIFGKQYAISALGGTQTGVDVNSVSKPFTVTFFRPQQLKALPQANPLTGVIKNVPMNDWKLRIRKGAQPASNQVPIVGGVEVIFHVPAGTDTYEPEELNAMISLLGGLLWANADGIATTVRTGVM